MAKVTRESVERMNKPLFNGFEVDISKLLMGDKIAVKKIALDEKRYINASLWFGKEYRNYRETSNTIVLNVSLYTKDGSVSVSYGLGHSVTLETDLTRKEWKQLAKHSEYIDDNYVLDIYNKHQGQLKNSRIL